MSYKNMYNKSFSSIIGIFVFLSVANITISNVLAESKIIKTDNSDNIEINKNLEKGKLFIYLGKEKTKITFNIDIAKTPKEKAVGLMNIKKIPDDYGMFFIFDRDRNLSFWMKNTYIPLDIIYINNEGNIVSIAKDTQPFSLNPIPSIKPARYVLEINAGLANKHGIQIGDLVRVEIEKQ